MTARIAPQREAELIRYFAEPGPVEGAGWTGYDRLQRDKLLQLAYALEEQRDKALERGRELLDALAGERDHAEDVDMWQRKVADAMGLSEEPPDVPFWYCADAETAAGYAAEARQAVLDLADLTADANPQVTVHPICSTCGFAYVYRKAMRFALTSGKADFSEVWIWQRDCKHKTAEPKWVEK